MAKKPEMTSTRYLTLRFDKIARLAPKDNEEEVLIRLQNELLLARKEKKEGWITLGGFIFKFLPLIALIGALYFLVLVVYEPWKDGAGCLMTTGGLGEVTMLPATDCGFCKDIV